MNVLQIVSFWDLTFGKGSLLGYLNELNKKLNKQKVQFEMLKNIYVDMTL